jgi:hypothetical protein
VALLGLSDTPVPSQTMHDGEATPRQTPTSGRAFTRRAVIIGFLMVLIVALITPINDWLLHNTFFYSQHLPVGVFLLIVLMGVVVNPLLGRRRFASGELLVIIGMLLVLGGVVSSGLNRVFPAIIAGPARVIPRSADLDAFFDKDGIQQLPRGPYIGLPEKGHPDSTSPQYRYVIDGFHDGLGQLSVNDYARVTWEGPDGVQHRAIAHSGPKEGTLDLTSPLGRAMAGQLAGVTVAGPDGPVRILAIESPRVPWAVWGGALLSWLPLLVPALVCFLAMAALVRRQWLHNERLPYPIANVITSYVEDPQPGSRFAPIFHSKWFWIAFTIAAVVLLSQGLYTLGILPLQIPTEIKLGETFNYPPFDQGYGARYYLTPKIYFSIVGIIFLIPADISFSLWFCFIMSNVAYMILRSQGVAVEEAMPSKVAMGGWIVQALLIVWIGRIYYLRLLRAAFRRDADSDIMAIRPYIWAFLAGAVGLVLGMVSFGAEVGSAIVAALCYLGIGLVLARLVAEAGLPFIQTPMLWSVNALIFSATGLAAPVAALVPLGMLGQTLCSDPREHLLPFATNAEYLAEKAGAPRRSWGAIAVLVLSIGTVVSGAVMLACAYYGQGYSSLDSWWRGNGGPMMSNFTPIASAANGGDPIGGSTTYACYDIGAFLTAGLGIARLMLSWWPIHPIGILVAASYPTLKIWFSFVIAWLLKVLVMRYGGVQLYKQLKPAALGLIAAEAVVAGSFLVVGLICGLLGDHYKQPIFLPG